MTSKTQAPEQYTPADFPGLRMLSDPELAALLAENTETGQVSASDFPVIKVPSGTGVGKFSIFQPGADSPSDDIATFDGIVVSRFRRQALFPRPFGVGGTETQSPVCSSSVLIGSGLQARGYVDEAQLVEELDESTGEVRIVPVGATSWSPACGWDMGNICSECPLNQPGTAHDGSGRLCKPSGLAIVAIAGMPGLYQMRIPNMSMDALNRVGTAAAFQGHRLSERVIRFELEPEKNASGISYYRIKYTLLDGQLDSVEEINATRQALGTAIVNADNLKALASGASAPELDGSSSA